MPGTGRGAYWNQQGPRGLKGDKGDKGDPGRAGPATVYIKRAHHVSVPNGPNQVTIAYLDLPTRNYLVSVTASPVKTAGAPRLWAVCSLWKRGVKLSTTAVMYGDVDTLQAQLAMSETVGSATPFTVILACNSYYDGRFLSDVHLTAIQAQSIVNQ